METKICGDCGIEKPLEDFHQHRRNLANGRQSVCKVCRKAKDNHRYRTDPRKRATNEAYYAKVAEAILQFKIASGGCCLCPPEHKEMEPIALDCHHLHGKEFTIGSAKQGGWGYERVLVELKKCVIVCANCHRKLHAGLIVGPGV